MHYDPVVNLNVSDPTDFHTYPEVKRKLYSALAEGDEGELAIAVPHQVLIKQVCRDVRLHQLYCNKFFKSANATSGLITSEGAYHDI